MRSYFLGATALLIQTPGVPLSEVDCQGIERVPAYVPDYFQALKELEESGFSMLKEIALHFLSETQLRVERLGQAIAQNDFKEISSLSHTLKGSLATFGLSRAAEVSRLIEAAANNGEAETIQGLAPLLAQAITPGRSCLERELESLG